MQRIYINELGAHKGLEVTIKGWIDVRRDQGKMVFFDFRDMTGIVQGVLLPAKVAELVEVIKDARPESVVEITGMVNTRPERNIVAGKLNGDIELEITNIIILNKAEPLPFEINVDTKEVDVQGIEVKFDNGKASFGQTKGKDNMPADAYAAPHTPDGGALDESILGGGAFDYSDVKTEGVKQRGAGCATKGFTSRGPLA